jgi:hypothetical protein
MWANLTPKFRCQDFIRSGWMALGPADVGLPAARVAQIYKDGNLP